MNSHSFYDSPARAALSSYAWLPTPTTTAATRCSMATVFVQGGVRSHCGCNKTLLFLRKKWRHTKRQETLSVSVKCLHSIFLSYLFGIVGLQSQDSQSYTYFILTPPPLVLLHFKWALQYPTPLWGIPLEDALNWSYLPQLSEVLLSFPAMREGQILYGFTVYYNRLESPFILF